MSQINRTYVETYEAYVFAKDFSENFISHKVPLDYICKFHNRGILNTFRIVGDLLLDEKFKVLSNENKRKEIYLELLSKYYYC